MFGQSTDTYIFWAVLLLGAGFVVGLVAGLVELARARSLPFFLLRRQALERGWRNLIVSSFFLILGLAVLVGGKPLVETVIPPTLTPTISPTPTITPTETLTPTITLTPSLTLPPTDTLTPSPTVPPTETPTPGYPSALITNIPEATVTPDPAAIIGVITVAMDQTDTGQPIGAASQFDAANLTKLIALYSYDKMTDGVQTSTIWYHDGQPVYIDTALWAGGTGGSTVSGDECTLAQCGFTAGNYRVAVFVGDQLKRFADFVITGTPPTVTQTATNTATPSNTPTMTLTPTITLTPTPSATYTKTATPTDTATRTATYTRTPSLTPSMTLTPSATYTKTATNTRVPTSTIKPIFATDYARTHIAETATKAAGGP